MSVNVRFWKQRGAATCQPLIRTTQSPVCAQTSAKLIKAIPPCTRTPQPVYVQLTAVLFTLVPDILDLNPEEPSHTPPAQARPSWITQSTRDEGRSSLQPGKDRTLD